MPKFEKSHEAHATWYEKNYDSEAAKIAAIEQWKSDQKNNNINKWLQYRYLSLTDSFTDRKCRWLTVGDPYGFDAHYLINKKQDVTASDIAGTFFPLVEKEGVLEKYAVENSEKLSFEDNSFDYILCKESYHHFPRPYLAVYEMLRVAKEAVILIEPQDPVAKMPLLLGLCNIMDKVDPKHMLRFWKNRYSYEVVGNYVFKLSEREIDKLANGIGVPAVAFKSINNNFYHPGIVNERADSTSRVFKKIRLKMRIRNALAKMTIIPSDSLCAVIFKTQPTQQLIASLKKEGFVYYQFPPNPYL